MKKLILLFLVFTTTVFSQEFIRKSDGTKISVLDGSVYIEQNRKKIGYLSKDDKKVRYVKYAALDYASFGGFLFKSFLIDTKRKGYFVIADHKDKILVCSEQTKIKNRGGFESTYSKFEIAVLNKESKIIETLSFTDENTDKNVEIRSKVIPMIRNHFSDCPKLLERISLFESPTSDTKNTTLLVFMNDPKFVDCN